MINALPLDELFLNACRQGGDLAEVFLESSQRTTIIHDDNRLEKMSTAVDTGLGLRVLHDTRTAFGSTNDLTPATLIDLASSVGAAAAKSEGPSRVASIAGSDGQPQGVKSHPSGIDLHKKAQIVKRANQIARGAGDSITQVKVMLRDHIRRIWVVDSGGVEASDEQVFVSLIVHVVCARGDVLQTSYESCGGTKGYEIFDETPPEEIAAAAARRAILMLDAMPAPAGPMPVVLAGTAGGTMIHEAVGHGLEADLAGEGLSVYRDRVGKQVASPLVSVYDDATLRGHRGSYRCDDEGAPAQKTLLIKNGVLESYLHNRVSAMRGDEQTTGNGRRQNYSYPPLVRMSNTLIAAGNDAPEDVLSSTHKGLFVKKMGGGQVNTVNGDFVFDVQEGYRIESGTLGEPVRGATLTGNGPKVLELIDKVGNDLGFSIGTCGKLGQEAPISCGQPTIRIPDIIVGGTG